MGFVNPKNLKLNRKSINNEKAPKIGAVLKSRYT